jgi:membrane protease YdiL (CAAX protease family)
MSRPQTRCPVPWGLRDMILALLLAVALVALGIGIVLGWSQLGPRLGLPAISRESLILVVLAMEWVLVLPAWFLGPGKNGSGWRSLGLRGYAWLSSLGPLLAVFLGTLVINGVWGVVRQRLGLQGQPDYLPLFGEGVRGLIMALVVGAIVAPFAEEVFFRGYLYAGLRQRWGVAWGLVISSLIFSVVHVIPGVMPPIFVMGLLLAWLYERTDSLWPSIALHGMINGMAFLAAYLIQHLPLPS